MLPKVRYQAPRSGDNNTNNQVRYQPSRTSHTASSVSASSSSVFSSSFSPSHEQAGHENSRSNWSLLPLFNFRPFRTNTYSYTNHYGYDSNYSCCPSFGSVGAILGVALAVFGATVASPELLLAGLVVTVLGIATRR